jgi:ABC-type lipoprotein export system ATPase subunit
MELQDAEKPACYILLQEYCVLHLEASGSTIPKLRPYLPGQLDRFRGQHIGMIFQQHYFFRGMDVIENLVAAQKLSGSEIRQTTSGQPDA